MLDLTKKKLPQAVEVGGRFYRIKTDYRYWLRFLQVVKEPAMLDDFDFLYIADIPEDKQAGVDALAEFCFIKNPLPRSTGTNSDPVFDYEIDADLVYAAFYERYGIDLLKVDLHWHQFNALLNGLHGTKLDDVISFRAFEPHDNTKYDQYMLNMKRAWQLETEMTQEETEALERFDSLLKD